MRESKLLNVLLKAHRRNFLLLAIIFAILITGFTLFIAYTIEQHTAQFVTLHAETIAKLIAHHIRSIDMSDIALQRVQTLGNRNVISHIAVMDHSDNVIYCSDRRDISWLKSTFPPKYPYDRLVRKEGKEVCEVGINLDRKDSKWRVRIGISGESIKIGTAGMIDEVVLVGVLVVGIGFLLLALVGKRGKNTLIEELAMFQEMETSKKLKSIKQMAGCIAQQVRYPVNSLSLGVQQMKVEHSKNETLDLMSNELEKLNCVVGNLLTISKPPKIKPMPTSVKQVLECVYMLYKEEIEQRGIEFNLQLPDEPIEVNWDEGHIHTVLLNLLRNAIEADSTSITIRAEKKGDELSIIVEDNGRGVTTAHLDTVCEPFFTTKDDGAGLGLMIVRELTQAHGGTFCVSTGFPRGFKVVLKFPVCREKPGDITCPK